MLCQSKYSNCRILSIARVMQCNEKDAMCNEVANVICSMNVANKAVFMLCTHLRRQQVTLAELVVQLYSLFEKELFLLTQVGDLLADVL